MPQKYYYAVVHKETGKLLVESNRLPIYWLKSEAEKRAKSFQDFIVQPVDIEKLERLILSHKNPKAI
jgi:DNA/RNA endonuclease G (NUC1)